nr:C39 family peptidase [uncultured Acetatifactor sp.]
MGGERDGMEEFLQRGSMAAQFARGALKTGKAVSGAAKGAAAGGPYGAAAGALWQGKKKIRKAIAAMATLLLLPVLFLAMLPGLLYDGFMSWISPSDPDTPILNSSTAITENANNITFIINSILSEALEETQAEIETDFASSGADCMEVVNPYAAGPVYNANLFASQYCAFRNDDYGSISIADMEEVLRGGKGHLYSFQRREEMRERTETDPETGEEERIAEKWMVYTISYNGEQYFADQVFHLTEEQKALAEDYAGNMSLFLGDGLLQNLAGWDGNSIPSLGDVSFTDGATEVAYFNQLDERYASQPYGTDHIGGYGCGSTCMAMVVSSLTEEYVEPTEMAQWAYENGYWCKGSGSYHALIPGAAANWGLPVSGCTASEPQRMLDALAEGKLVVAIMSEGHFTKGGHFIVLRGVKDGKIMVADPASYRRSGQLWDLETILKEASRRAGAGGPFWIIG